MKKLTKLNIFKIVSISLLIMELPQDIIDICFNYCDATTKQMMRKTNKYHNSRYEKIFVDPVQNKTKSLFGFFHNDILIKKASILKHNFLKWYILIKFIE